MKNISSIVNKFFKEIKKTEFKPMEFLRSIDRIKYDTDTFIAIFNKIENRTKKEFDLTEIKYSNIVEFCNENIKFISNSKISDKNYKEINEFSNFGNSYQSDLEDCLKHYGPNYTEIDFLLEQIKFADSVINKVELSEHKQGNKNWKEPYLDEEIELFRQRKFKFERRMNGLETNERISKGISTLNYEQSSIDIEQVRLIIEKMELFIDEKMKYYEDNFNLNYKTNLKRIFNITTNQFRKISDARKLSTPLQKLAWTNKQISLKDINHELKEFKLIFSKIYDINPSECINLIHKFNSILDYYNYCCSVFQYDFKKSYCFELINNFYNDLVLQYCNTQLPTSLNHESKTLIKKEAELDFKENNFNTKPCNEVKAFFTEQLSEFCSEKTINEFLISAFTLVKTPSVKYTFEVCHKEKIMNVFHKFFEKCNKPRGKAERYAGLLSEYFNEFTDAKYVKKNWVKYQYNRSKKSRNVGKKVEK